MNNVSSQLLHHIEIIAELHLLDKEVKWYNHVSYSIESVLWKLILDEHWLLRRRDD